jgi:alpha-beta hydrolase superfamily lysophospholipase
MMLMDALVTGTIAAPVPDPAPSLVTVAPRSPARGVALIAHGGRSKGTARDSNLRTPALRMFPFLADLARAGRRGGLAVAQLRYRMVGYNDGDPVRDLEWALNELSGRFAAPVCLIGHSMGARAALRAAGHDSVQAVAGLAAWCPPEEPVAQLAGRTVMLMHGSRDRVTDPAGSLHLGRRARGTAARIARFEVAGAGHAMLERLPLWQAITRRFVLGALGLEPMDERIAAAFALPPERALRVPL